MENEELQEQTEENAEIQDVETTESEEAVKSGSESESEETYINQEAVNKAINRQHKKYRDEQRAHQETQKRLKEYEERLNKLEKAEPPKIPDLPDTFDADYANKIAAREEALREHERYRLQQEALKQRQEAARQEAIRQQNDRIANDVKKYNARVKAFGIPAEENARDEQTLAQFGVSQELAEYLLATEAGPLYVRHLAANLDELASLTSMNPMQTVEYINKVIAPKAENLKPRLSNAPDPVRDPPPGRASDPHSEYIRGVTFE